MKKAIDTNSREYRNAYIKHLMGEELNREERANLGMDGGNSSGGYAIAGFTRDKVVEWAVKVAPLIDEAELMHFAGKLVIGVEGSVADAAIHPESAPITPSDDSIIAVELDGYEIAKLVPASIKLAEMSIDGFEDWLCREIGRSLGWTIERYLVLGTGNNEPMGLKYSDTWVDGSNAVEFSSEDIGIGEVEELAGMLNPAYVDGAKFLMNWNTFWNKLCTQRDADKPQMITGNHKDGWKIFGYSVLLSDSVSDGDIFFGNYREAIKANFAQDIVVEVNRSSGFRNNAIDFKGSCVFDSYVIPGRTVYGYVAEEQSEEQSE